MTAFIRKIFMILIGLLAGTASWAVIELLFYFGESIKYHLLWNSFAGASIGLFFGLFFGSAEGIILSDFKRSIRGAVSGSNMGLAAGVLVVLLAQSLLYSIGNAELFTSSVNESILIPVFRSLSWSLLGLVIGSIDGIRSRSIRKIGIGLSGGFLGGLAGGILLELLTKNWSNGFFARGIGLAVMGVGIGLFYTLFEFAGSNGLIRVLTGSLRGKEYLIVMKKTKIGNSLNANIPLGEYAGVVANHAILKANKKEIIIEESEGTVLVNDQPISKHELKYEDVIQIGDAKLFYLPR
ncbi:MAG: FHA domain-containing protein [Spirochaetales bacterium]|nr:FHA domain-containing protein [Spirochaetales bacterium]